MLSDWTEDELERIYDARERVEIAAGELTAALRELPHHHPSRQALDEVVLDVGIVLVDLRP
ncbi:MAG TPA: hypothetical protein VFA66_10265 [Gaiellaceae bacterium]|nr:hypothetical protein [Gaiellaceae bacterium]